MNGALLLLSGAVFFISAYFLYGRYLGKLFGIDESHPTPAHTRQDGVDYIPTRLPVLFGHHFASIAGAGPIVGPIMAAFLGWGPVVLWLLLGGVFIGAMHDFSALFLSVRNGGRSIGSIVEQQIGFAGRQVFLLFSWVALVLVVAIFALFVAKTFVKSPSVATASLLFIAMAPVFGFLVNRKGVKLLPATLIFVPLLFLSIRLGAEFPLDLIKWGLSAAAAKTVWLAVLFLYAAVASILPVWLLLQPRDYLNSYLLYAMMIAGFCGIIVAAPHFHMKAFYGWSAYNYKGDIGHLFPILFVTVACGACSGFHALVASGTTSKQISRERDILRVGYGAMLVEGLLALMALISVAVLSQSQYFEGMREMGPVALFAGGLASFTEHIGLDAAVGKTFFALAIAAFLLTTLDTATRLARFIWQELFEPGERAKHEQKEKSVLQEFFANRVTATLIVTVLAGVLAFSGSAWDIWPVFGASNQMLASMTLLVVTLYLVRKKVNFLIAFVPMLVMTVVTVWALVVLFKRTLGQNLLLTSATAFLLLMAGCLAVMAVLSLKKISNNK